MIKFLRFAHAQTRFAHVFSVHYIVLKKIELKSYFVANRHLWAFDLQLVTNTLERHTSEWLPKAVNS